MPIRTPLSAIAILAALLLLSGCADIGEGWDGAISSIGLSSRPHAPAASAHQAAPSSAREAAALNAWCLQVAAQERDEAAHHGFDAQTQQRRYEVAYQQCSALAVAPATP